eukprot:TRINITY_DN10665_c0_g1_i2.p1 TRINITY_DN10665_c0_g1~~TRINITY_DN10665_c0_g1_i2.p1  ORF type:complete len:356 (-),score=16.67 TRINITY_DN10665_c0_g1_i2:43-1110(-)
MSLASLLFLLFLLRALAYRRSDSDENTDVQSVRIERPKASRGLAVVPSASKVFAVTCTTSADDFRVAHLHARLRLLGYEVKNLDCGDAFQFASINKWAWGLRVKHYAAFIEQIRNSDPDALVVFLDAYDMLVEGDSREAAQRFALFNSSLVVSCVYYQWPRPKHCHSYTSVPPTVFFGKTNCMYPCAGALMGKVSHLHMLFAAGGYTQSTDDQCWLYRILNTHFKPQTDWILDTNGSLFLSYTSAWEAVKGSTVEDGRHVLDISRSAVGREARPTFIHLDSSHVTEPEMKALLGCSSTDQADSICKYEEVHVRSDSRPWPLPAGMDETPYWLFLLALLVFCVIVVGCAVRNWRKV